MRTQRLPETFAAVAVAIAASALLAACAAGPDVEQPSTPTSAGYAPGPALSRTVQADTPMGEPQQLRQGARVDAQWWQGFGSASLDRLMAQALGHNFTLQAAQAALRAAQEIALAQRAALLPNAQASYAAQRNKPSPNDPSSSVSAPYTLQTAQLTVGFAPDVFGGGRRQLESLQAQADVQRFEIDAVRVTLQAGVVAAVIDDALLRRQIDLVQAQIAAGEAQLAIVQRQRSVGHASTMDVAAQESALAQTRQLLFPLRKQFEQNRDLLRTLVGTAQDTELPVFEMNQLTLPRELPLTLPGELLRQRPDVLAAEAQVRAASAAIGATAAARWPQFTIDASLGGSAAHASQLFAPGGPFYAVMASLTAPLFDAGAQRHREAAARAQYEQAIAQYRQTVLAAWQNVADALHAIDSDAQALEAAAQGADATGRMRDLMRRQHQAGYLDRLALIGAEQADRQARLALAQAQGARLIDTALLFQALGGGAVSSRP